MSERPELSVLPVADPVAELPPREAVAGRASLGMRIASLAAVIVPFLGLFAAAVFLWGWGFSWVDLGILVGMYLLTALGITVGFHRLFTHRSFETWPVIQFILGVLGSMAVEGPLLKWVAMHRRHHQYSDRPEDPHSPHHQGRGVLGVLRGLWHAHIGWMFKPEPPDLDRYVKDLRQSRLLRMVSALFVVWVAVGLVIPAVLGGVLTGSWVGVWSGLAWGGLVRIFLVHHVTWSINSVDGLFLCWRVRHGLFEDNLLEGNGRFGISIGHKDTDNLLQRNRVLSNASSGVFFRNESAGMAAHRNHLKENIIENNGQAGIRVRGATDGLVFEKNIVRDTRQGDRATQSIGILVEERAGRVKLIGNTIEADREVEDRRSERP